MVAESCMMLNQVVSLSGNSILSFTVGDGFQETPFTMSVYKVLVSVDVVLVEEAEEIFLMVKESSKVWSKRKYSSFVLVSSSFYRTS